MICCNLMTLLEAETVKLMDRDPSSMRHHHILYCIVYFTYHDMIFICNYKHIAFQYSVFRCFQSLFQNIFNKIKLQMTSSPVALETAFKEGQLFEVRGIPMLPERPSRPAFVAQKLLIDQESPGHSFHTCCLF